MVQDYCRRTGYANVLHWHSAFGFETVSQDYASLDMPVRAVANPVTVAITDVLGSSIGNVRREIVKGAGNFFIFSHSAE